MSVFDYIGDYKINVRVAKRAKRLRGREKKDEFVSEVYRELYDFMPFDREEINLIINRVYAKYIEGGIDY